MDKETSEQRSAHMARVYNALLCERRKLIVDEYGACPLDGAMSAYSAVAKMFFLAQQIAERHPEAYAAAIRRLEEKMQNMVKGPPPAPHIFPPEWRGDYVNALRAAIELAKRNLDS